MTPRRWWILVIAATMLALAVVPAQALGRPVPRWQGSVVQVGEDWVLPPGEVARGDVLVVAANATVSRDATLEGNLTVLSGNATVEGTVRGNVNVLEGNLYLRRGSLVTGDVNVALGDVVQEPGARVEGQINWSRVQWEGVRPAWPLWLLPLLAGQPPEPGAAGWFFTALLRVILGVLRALIVSAAVAAIAAILTLLWPDEISRVARTVEEAWLPALGIGLLTWVVGGLLVVLLVITLCLAVLGIIGLFALLAVALLGWTAVGKLIGDRLWAALGLDVTVAVWPTFAGTFLITLLTRVPCVGFIFGFFVGSIALGAAVLTLYAQFGRREAPSVG